MKKKMYVLCGLLIEQYRTVMKTTSRKEKKSAPISVNNHVTFSPQFNSTFL